MYTCRARSDIPGGAGRLPRGGKEAREGHHEGARKVPGVPGDRVTVRCTVTRAVTQKYLKTCRFSYEISIGLLGYCTFLKRIY